MSKIILDEKFYIVKDSAYNWILHYEEAQDKINPKTGLAITSRDHWYFPSLKLLLKKYVDEHVKLSPAKTVQDLLNRINGLESKIDQICRQK